MRLRLTIAVILIALCPAPTTQAAGNPDWPCIQREVPQITPGMVWTGGAIDPEDKTWSDDPKVAPKVAEISSRRKAPEEAIAIIDEFAAGLKEDRTQLLTALFAGVLQSLNTERRKIIAGIKRFAHKQTQLAESIKTRSTARAELAGKPSPSEAEQQKLAGLEEQLNWDTRIYDERQQSLRYVCETPVFLEKKLFQIGRHVSQLISQN